MSLAFFATDARIDIFTALIEGVVIIDNMNNILGQKSAIDSVLRWRSAGKSSGSFIFAGLTGTGRLTTAKAYSRLLLCHNPVEAPDSDSFIDSCGTCQSCKMFSAGSHPDFGLIYKELLKFTKNNKHRTTPIDMAISVIREFLIDKASSRPSLSSRKVFVITEVENMNKHSQNALLKTLEEPADFCTIILLCNRVDRLLPTIRSRCQTINFQPLATALIEQHFQDFDLSSDKLKFFARFSRGSLGIARHLANLESDFGQLYDFKTRIIAKLSRFTLAGTLDFAQNLIDCTKALTDSTIKQTPSSNNSVIARDSRKLIINIICSAFYDSLISDIKSSDNLTNSDQPDQIAQLSAKFDKYELCSKISLCYAAITKIDSSVNERLIFEQLLLNIIFSDTISVLN